MNVYFDNTFKNDIGKIKDTKLLNKLKTIITRLESIDNLFDIRHIKKIQGFKENYYRIAIGNYRVGLELINNEIHLVRFQHRKNIYKYFPKK